MKGEYQLLYTAFASFVVVAAILGGRFIVVTSFYNADIDSQITQREVNAISVSYALMDCMKEGNNSVSVDFIEKNADKNICDLCKICNILAETRITDLESDPKKEWMFEYSTLKGLSQLVADKVFIWKQDRQKKATSVYLNIDYGDYSHVGRLDVNV